MGGIHRAQPYGYATLQKPVSKPILAPWVHFTHDDKVSEYEGVRSARFRAIDVGLVGQGTGNSIYNHPTQHGQRSRLGYSRGREPDLTCCGGSGYSSGGAMFPPDDRYSATYLMATRGYYEPVGSSEYEDLPAMFRALATPEPVVSQIRGSRAKGLAVVSSSGSWRPGALGHTGSSSTSTASGSVAGKSGASNHGLWTYQYYPYQDDACV
ncbi:hypothetical protein Micbo1qcDRAFT_160329, partial [Microdochium bolleyi]